MWRFVKLLMVVALSAFGLPVAAQVKVGIVVPFEFAQAYRAPFTPTSESTSDSFRFSHWSKSVSHLLRTASSRLPAEGNSR